MKNKDIESLNFKPTITLVVKRAHTQVTRPMVNDYEGRKKGVINFLKRKKIPYNYDVTAEVWDGVKWHFSPTETGDDFLKNPNAFDSYAEEKIGRVSKSILK